MFADFLKTLDSSVSVLTVNQRLCAYLNKQYDKEQQQAGHITWPSLDCLPLQSWIIRTYNQLLNTALVLSESQELFIWEHLIADTIKHSSAHSLLLRSWPIAHALRQTWHLLIQFNVPLALLEDTACEDAYMFYQWAKQFEAICKLHHWTDQTSCLKILIQECLVQKIPLPKHIVLAGFEEISPHIKSLMDTLSSHCQFHFYQPTRDPHSMQRLALSNQEDELRTMAHYARHELQKNSHVSIGCVIPQLHTIRNKVERIFTEVFSKNYSSLDHSENIPFNISSGKPFNHYPVIHTAFKILQLNVSSEISIQHISHLLRSPFLGGSEQEITSRASLDVLLRQIKDPYLTPQHILSSSKKNPQCAIWAMQLENYLKIVQNAPREESFNFWAYFFFQQLECMGWPGERPLDSAEYQLLNRWQKLLTEFSHLKIVLNKSITQHQAVEHLFKLAENIEFQPQTIDLPIQVLGTLEAAGICFDHLWVMGMNDEAWPASPCPNPFIPIQIQRQFNMPHASAARELQFSQTLTNRFSKSSDQIIFSYSLQEDDKPLRASSLIEEFPPIPLNLFSSMPDIYFYTGAKLETVVDEMAPSVEQHELLRGGALILKEQAACPFRAFAKIRLGAAKLPVSSYGLTAQERGIYLHEILERIWGSLGCHGELSNYNSHTLTLFMQSCIDHILTIRKKQRPFILKNNFIEIERRRLLELVQEWLIIEKNRPPFHVVARESTHQISLGSLTFNVRIDRTDTLDNNLNIIIDYKTGQPRIEDWFGDRPDDPQMSLYFLASEQAIHGLLFAQVRPNQCQFKGITAQDTGISGTQIIHEQTINDSVKTWEDFQKQQFVILENLAKEFQSGLAKVDPKYSQETCRNCDLHALCRIHEQP